MSIVTLISEAWRFIKDYKWRLLFGAIIVSLLAMTGRFFIHRFLYSDNLEAYDHLTHVYQQEPASFQMVVTMEDGSIFSTANLFDEYFATPAVVEEVENQTEIEFSKTLLAEEELEMYRTPQFRGGLAAVRDSTSNIITLRFLLAESAEDNLLLAQVYAERLQEESIPFLGTNTVTIIQEPVQGELVVPDLVDEIPTEETLTPYDTLNTRGTILYGILGIILGVFLTAGLSFLFHLARKTIHYAFDYSWDFNDHHLLVKRTDETHKNNIEQLIHTPANIRRLIVRQGVSSDEVDFINKDEKELLDITIAQLADYQGAVDQPEEIVIVIDSNQTLKSWYREQYELAKLYPARIKILHVI